MTVIIVALIGALATIVASFVSAHATVRSAEMEAKKGSRSSADIIQALKKHARGIRAWTSVLAVLVGLAFGLLFRELKNSIAEGVRVKAMGDLAHLKEIGLVSITKMSDRQDTRPWKIDGKRSKDLSLDNCASRGKDGALRLSVDLEPIADSNECWGGAWLDADSLPEARVDLVVAWVYLPPSQSGAAAAIKALIRGSTKDDEGHLWWFYGREVALKSDSWMPLLLPMSRAVEQATSEDGNTPVAKPIWLERRLQELTIMIWATSEPYKGPVFIDDVSFWQSEVLPVVKAKFLGP